MASLPVDTTSVMAIVKMSQLARGDGQPEAKEFAEAGVDMARSIGDPRYLGEALCCLGLTLSFQGDYESALKTNIEAEQAFKKIAYEPGIVRAIMNSAVVYLNRHNYDIAKRQLLEAQEIVDRLNLEKFKVNINTNLAIIYTEEKQFDKALALHQHSLLLLEKNNDPLKLSVCYTNIGYVYDQQKRYAEALPYFEKAFDKAKESVGGLYYEGAFALQNIVATLLELNRLPEAERRLAELWPIAREANSANLLAEVYRTSARLNKKLGNYQRAYTDFERYTVLHDSLINEDQNIRVADLQKEYDILKRDATIARIEQETAVLKAAQTLQNQDTKRKSVFIWGLAILGILLLIALVVMILVMHSRNAALTELRSNQALIETQHREIDLQNQALKLQNERLEDLNREKDGLVSIVAHDLKSPMNKALALSELLKLQGDLNEDQLRSVQMMGKVASAGNDLIRDLLDLNAVEDPDMHVKLELVDIAQLWHEIEVGFGGEASRKAIVLHFEAAADLPKTFCDRKALSRVMDNLVSNAMKFSPRGRQVWVRAARLGAMRLRLEVADEGPGISTEDQQKLFKKFQRLSARPTGGENSTGLGLAITQALVHKLGGEISLHSKLGEGATFVVELPIGAAQA
jgi:signal transduction histidine kinase